MLREEQIDIRRKRAKAVKFKIENLGKNRVFSDYRVMNPESGGQYTVAVRGFEVGDNTCTCPDFKANTLGTCKHVEAVLDTLKDDIPPHLQKKKAEIKRPEIFLYYGEQLQLGIHLPGAPLRQAQQAGTNLLRRQMPLVRPREVPGVGSRRRSRAGRSDGRFRRAGIH